MNKDFNLEFGERVRNKRIELGITQSELAEKLGFKSKQSIHHIECGRSALEHSRIIELARVLNVTPAYLMGWDEEAEAEKAELVSIIGNLNADQRRAALDFLRLMSSKK